MDKILNLTNFPASPKQKEQGVIDCSEIDKIKKLLLFTHQPTAAEIRERATLIVHIASKEGCDKAFSNPPLK